MSEQQLGEDEATAVEAACTRLIHIFAHWIDARRYDDLLGLMTADCIVEWPGNRMRADELVAALKQTPANRVSMHVITTTLFAAVRPDHAECVSYLSFYQGEKREDGSGPLAGPAVLGEYHDRFERTADGWRISARTVKPTMSRD
jgi:hypothetical protein